MRLPASVDYTPRVASARIGEGDRAWYEAVVAAVNADGLQAHTVRAGFAMTIGKSSP